MIINAIALNIAYIQTITMNVLNAKKVISLIEIQKNVYEKDLKEERT